MAAKLWGPEIRFWKSIFPPILLCFVCLLFLLHAVRTKKKEELIDPIFLQMNVDLSLVQNHDYSDMFQK